MSHAFKEWQVIVEALGAGEQILILRKGGIAEDGGGFEAKAGRFWLFPTHFHEQIAQTKPAATKWFNQVGGVPPSRNLATSGEVARVHLRYFAEVVRHSFLSDWASVARLDPFHLWSEETIHKRFEWAHPPGLHAFAVRAHRLREPVRFELTPAMGGCKSWIDLPLDFAACASEPVLEDAVFAKKLEALKLT